MPGALPWVRYCLKFQISNFKRDYFWSFESNTLLGDNPDPEKTEFVMHALQCFTLVMYKV